MAYEQVEYNLLVKRYSTESWIVIEGDRQKILCVWNKQFPYMIASPVEFKSHAAAERWIQDGTIAEIQEAFGNLAVGFTRKMITTLRDGLGKRIPSCYTASKMVYEKKKKPKVRRF